MRVPLVTAAANRADATVIASGMTAPHQIALYEANGDAYVVEFANPGRLWRIDLATGAKTAVVSNLNRAVGLVLSADGQFPCVSEQGANRVVRITRPAALSPNLPPG